MVGILDAQVEKQNPERKKKTLIKKRCLRCNSMRGKIRIIFGEVIRLHFPEGNFLLRGFTGLRPSIKYISPVQESFLH
jgi:ribosomal protein S14